MLSDARLSCAFLQLRDFQFFRASARFLPPFPFLILQVDTGELAKLANFSSFVTLSAFPGKAADVRYRSTFIYF